MIILFYVIYNCIAILCIIYMIFNFMDVASWLYVEGKKVVLAIYNWLKRISK